VRTDRTIPNNKPDIIIRDNEKGNYLLIDVAISRERIVIKKVAEEILKYEDFIIEIQHMRNFKAKEIPVITGENGTISKSLGKYLSNIPGKQEIKKLQNADLLDTTHILRKLRMYISTEHISRAK
jgi:hypothetical protein